MIVGIGTDIIEISRLRKSVERSGELFLKHVYTDRELAEAPERDAVKYPYLAGRWAAKEAVAKALGTGITGKCAMREIDVSNDDEGAPLICLTGEAAKTSLSRKIRKWHISISHEHEYACAMVVAED